MKAIEIEWHSLVKDVARCKRCRERDDRRIAPEEESHELTPAWLLLNDDEH
jgi:hypothetical protein